MKYKFKVGDKITRNSRGTSNYDFSGSTGYGIPGKILTVSHRGVNEEGEILYNVHGSYQDKPNWTNMEKNFDLVKQNWKMRLTQ